MSRFFELYGGNIYIIIIAINDTFLNQCSFRNPHIFGIFRYYIGYFFFDPDITTSIFFFVVLVCIIFLIEFFHKKHLLFTDISLFADYRRFIYIFDLFTKFTRFIYKNYKNYARIAAIIIYRRTRTDDHERRRAYEIIRNYKM